MSTDVRVFVLNPSGHLAKALFRAFETDGWGNIVIDPENETVANVKPLAPLIEAITSARTELTHREEEVAAQVRAGKTNREIATALAISERTVESHISSIYSKLMIGSRVQLAMHPIFSGR